MVKGEFYKRLEKSVFSHWVANPDVESIGTADEEIQEDVSNVVTKDAVLDWFDEAGKEFYVILNDATNHPFEHTINRLDECIEKWFGDGK